MRLRVIDKALVADGVVRIRMGDQAGGGLPPAEPGAHVEVSLQGMVRRYSLTSLPGSPFYEIHVQRAEPSAGRSAYIHDCLTAGDEVEVSEPRDGFPPAPNAPRAVFIAGGIGITPFLTMIPAMRAVGMATELHYAVRTESRRIPLPADVGPVERHADGDRALDVSVLLARLTPAVVLYVCGPRALIEAVRTQATERGWPKDHVRFESFGFAPQATDGPVRLRLEHSGIEIDVPPGMPLLDALLKAGVWAPFECRRGECGSCHVAVTDGVADHRDLCLTAEQRAAGLCTCVSWARTPGLTLQL